MRTRFSFQLGLIAAAAFVPSCDGITSGMLSDTTDPLTLVKIMIQDELPRGGRNIATDLLERSPKIACNADTMPCAVGNQGNAPCVIPMGQTMGICPDPLDPSETPPAIGTPAAHGGNAIRLVFNKILDLSIETAKPGMTPGSFTYVFEPGVIEFDGPDGKPFDSLIYYDPSGSPDTTSDIFVEPYGPAIVIKPNAPMSASAKYTIKILDATKIKDKRGLALTRDKLGPIMTSYDFTTEALYALSFAPDFTAAMAMPLAPTDAEEITTNADFDEKTLAPNVVVKDKAGMVVMTEAFADRGTRPVDKTDPMMKKLLPTKPKKDCDGDMNTRQLDIVRVSAPGVVVPWDAGDYTITIKGLKGDSFGAADMPAGTFTVKAGTAVTNDETALALPEQCI